MTQAKVTIIIPGSLIQTHNGPLHSAITRALQASKVDRTASASASLHPGEAIHDICDWVLIVSSISAAWFTKKWCDDYLWPEIKRLVDVPSKQLFSTIRRQAPDTVNKQKPPPG